MAKILSDKKGAKIKISARIDEDLHKHLKKQSRKRSLTEALEEMIQLHKDCKDGTI